MSVQASASPVVESRAGASYVQRSMWATAARWRGVPLNVMLIPWLVSGPLDAAALCAAIGDLGERHPTLRSVLRYESGSLHQVTHANGPATVEYLDWSGPTPGAQMQRALEAMRAEARQGVDVERGPVLRARLFTLAPERHLLAFITHHAMCDGWSTQIMLRDLAGAYRARARGEADLPGPAAADYAALAAETMVAGERGDFGRELAYWARQLERPPPPLALPATGSRKGQRDFGARSVIQIEPPASMVALREVARAHRVSPFAVMLSALGVLLRSQTGVQDMLLGVSTLNRWSAASRDIVGCFTSMLPARVRPREGIASRDLLTQTHAMLRELLAYGRVPFELIVRHLQTGFGGAPALPVWCQMLEPSPDVDVPDLGVVFHPLRIERAAMQCEIEFDLLDAPSGLQCDLAHRRVLFEEAYIETLGERFRLALRLICAQPSQPVDELVERVATGA